MTFDECESEIVSRKQALRELKKHGFSDASQIAEFDSELGVHESYPAMAVLIWLGY
jgi:hypothetical protein